MTDESASWKTKILRILRLDKQQKSSESLHVSSERKDYSTIRTWRRRFSLRRKRENLTRKRTSQIQLNNELTVRELVEAMSQAGMSVKIVEEDTTPNFPSILDGSLFVPPTEEDVPQLHERKKKYRLSGLLSLSPKKKETSLPRRKNENEPTSFIAAVQEEKGEEHITKTGRFTIIRQPSRKGRKRVFTCESLATTSDPVPHTPACCPMPCKLVKEIGTSPLLYNTPSFADMRTESWVNASSMPSLTATDETTLNVSSYQTLEESRPGQVKRNEHSYCSLASCLDFHALVNSDLNYVGVHEGVAPLSVCDPKTAINGLGQMPVEDVSTGYNQAQIVNNEELNVDTIISKSGRKFTIQRKQSHKAAVQEAQCHYNCCSGSDCLVGLFNNQSSSNGNIDNERQPLDYSHPVPEEEKKGRFVLVSP